MGKALYRKYRSRSLSEVVGQGHVTDILARSLKQGKIAHAYLLTGPRGVGKTSIARILAHEINQLPYSDESTHLDIIEIDAASNNGVEDVRDLREKVNLAPVSAAKKVYIIDEVHMLSKAAFNALLKTLEEPPEHVVFILATTDVDKLPATIISRTQRFGFRAISRDDAVKHLRVIADKEKIKIDDVSLALLAERGDGSFRDSISLLDQLSALADETTGITPDLVETTLGLAPQQSVDTLLAAVKAHDSAQIVAQLDEFDKSGVQASVLTSQLIATVRSHIAEHPQLIGLLDSLLEVGKSSHPNIKLLTVLLNFATPKAKSAALTAPAAVISRPVEELGNGKWEMGNGSSESAPARVSNNEAGHLDTKEAPIDSGRGIRSVSSNGTKSEVQPKSLPVVEPEKDVARNGAFDESSRDAERENHESKTEIKHNDASDVKEADAKKDWILNQVQNDSSTTEIDWPKLISHVKQNHIALHSVLSKCGYEQNGNLLKIYTGTAFYKKKLDDTKYRPILAESIVAIGAGELEIDTIATPPPLKDSKAAAIAAIMGGGEEVSL